MGLRIEIPLELEQQLRFCAAGADVNTEDFILHTLSERLTVGIDPLPVSPQNE